MGDTKGTWFCGAVEVRATGELAELGGSGVLLAG